MASLVTDSIRSALRDLGLLDEQLLLQQIQFSTKKLKYFLKNLEIFLYFLKDLEIFLLCTRKSAKDVRGLRSYDNPGSLLERIADTVERNSLKIQPYCLGIEGGSHFSLANQIIHFEGEIQLFEDEIDRSYKTLSKSRLRSTSPTKVTEIIDSILENLGIYLSLKFQYVEHSLEPIEAMSEKMTFLRNFIRFVTLQSIEHRQLENFLVHVESVAVNAAHLSYMTQCDFNYKKWSKRMQKIQAADLPVYETYIEALRNSRLSHLRSTTPHMDRDPIIVMKDFIDFLLWNLWEMLKMDTCLVISLKDQLQPLYEGLRFLRTILQEQPNKFDEHTSNLTRVLMCDAGIIIFSLYQKNFHIDAELSDLLVFIEFIRGIVEGRVPEISAYNFPRTNELGFMDSLLENLRLTSGKADSSAQSQFLQTIHEDLVLLRSFLEEIVELHNDQEELQALWDRVIEVAYKVELLLDQLALGDFQDSISTAFDCMIEDIRNIKTDALKIFHGGRKDFKIKKVSKTPRLAPSQSIARTTDEIVGLCDEERSITNQLTRGSKQLKIIAIVGMPGIGKTTLATKVYHDPSITYHFEICGRCSVSQLFDKKKVLLKLLNNIAPGGNLEMTEEDLAEKLRRHLKGKRYLIFLDDIWDIEAWNSLQGSFPNDSRGSRIILTSRLCDVVPQGMLSEEPHFLRQLTSDESLELLRRKLFPGTCWPPALYELGEKIAENCKGLPLTIVVVAGLLANLEPEGWKNVLENLSSGIISSTEQCMNTLDLSYRHLPEYLKPCFLYFGLFPEDQEISVQRLIWLWIAEGFVCKTEQKSLEDVASNYMTDLVGRSLVIVAKTRSIGGVKTCRIHDLLHDFCRRKAREENFFHLLKGYDELLSFDEPRYLRRLCIHSQKKHFKNLRLFSPRVHSLLFFVHSEPWSIRGHDIAFIIPIYKHLRVLDIGQFNLGFGFPIEMRILVLLKYLSVKGDIGDIPSLSIDNLSKLETLVVESTKTVSLPDTIWDLRSLRHLHIPNGFHIPRENLNNSPDLCELESCSGAIIHSWEKIEKLLRKFPNIRRLKCRIFQHWDTNNCNMILIPDFLSRLESLDITPSFYPGWHGVPRHFQYEFGFPKSLKKLTLNYFELPQSIISAIGELPDLEVLKLMDGSFPGDNWDMVEGEFSKLRFLKLSYWNIVQWTASDDQFPCLEKLVLEGCRRLGEIPSCLENTVTLEVIEVRGCSDSVASSVKKIQDVQMQIGNSVLKILVSPGSGGSS